MEKSKLDCIAAHINNLEQRHQEKDTETGNDLTIGDFSTLHTWLFSLHYSEMYTWDVQILSYQNRFWETLTSIIKLWWKTVDNLTLITSGCSEHLLYKCMVTKSCKKGTPRNSTSTEELRETHVSDLQSVHKNDIPKVE